MFFDKKAMVFIDSPAAKIPAFQDGGFFQRNGFGG